jgi:hypothetical protein
LEKPLVGVEVSAGTDLNIGTRSGVGDHIFYATAKTDRDGRFVLRHRFPNYLWIDVMPALWMRTKINGVWTEVDNRIKPDPSTNTIELELTDSKGSPMGSIQVELTAATEPRHFHEHHFQVVDTQTHADGTYSAVTPSPWVTDINASLRQDDHYSLIAQKMAGERPMPPGIYDLHSDPAPGEKSPPAVAK